MTRPAWRNYGVFTLLAVIVGLGLFVFIGGRKGRPDPKLEPDRFAWYLFADINQPAATPGNNDVLWETWADTKTVYGNPLTTPVWPSRVHSPLRFGKHFKELALLQELAKKTSRLSPSLSHDSKVSAIHQLDQSIKFLQPGQSSTIEVRLNRAAFQYIVDNKLWYKEGQEEAFRGGNDLNFPKPAIEIKARWAVLTDQQDPKRYHCQVGPDHKTYGLVGLHITTKDLPNWFWATFEHVDNKRRCSDVPCRDTFGLRDEAVSPELAQLFRDRHLGPEWANYRLSASQIDFVDGQGRPTLCGNSEIEGSINPNRNIMKTSSCITCHGRATVNGEGQQLDVFLNPDPEKGYVGPLDPAWFTEANGKRKYIKLDFVWTLMEAKYRNTPPQDASPGSFFSFERDIKPMFSPIDIAHMAQMGVKLDDYVYMSNPSHAAAVYGRLTGTDGPVMPPEGKWPQANIDKFKTWMSEGYQK